MRLLRFLYAPIAAAAWFCMAVVGAPALGSHCQAGVYASRVVEATFKLYNVDSTSACFLVRTPEPQPALWLVTSAHTAEAIKGETAVLVLREPNEDGSFKRRDHTITVRKDEQPLWHRHATEDAAVLRLEEPLPVDVNALPEGWLGVHADLLGLDIHVGSPLLVLTYPHRFEANSAGFPVARSGIFASPPRLPVASQPTYLANFNTFAGDSGAPVFIAKTPEQPLIVGMVIAQIHHNETINGPSEDRVIRHPLNLGKVLHAEFIRQTLASAISAGNCNEAEAVSVTEAQSDAD